MSKPSVIAPITVSTSPPATNGTATAHRWSTLSWLRLNAIVPIAQTTAPTTAYVTPSVLMWPPSAPVLTSTMPANPTTRPTTLAAPIDSPSSRQARTATSNGWR